MDNQNLFITKIQEKIEKFILPTASKLSSQRHLASIRDGHLSALTYREQISFINLCWHGKIGQANIPIY